MHKDLAPKGSLSLHKWGLPVPGLTSVPVWAKTTGLSAAKQLQKSSSCKRPTADWQSHSRG